MDRTDQSRDKDEKSSRHDKRRKEGERSATASRPAKLEQQSIAVRLDSSMSSTRQTSAVALDATRISIVPSRSTPAGKSLVPTKSIVNTKYDETMASRQTQINDLSPTERKKQEEWAQKQLQVQGSCVKNCDWVRIKIGYQCRK
jgi:hypothetical protein